MARRGSSPTRTCRTVIGQRFHGGTGLWSYGACGCKFGFSDSIDVSLENVDNITTIRRAVTVQNCTFHVIKRRQRSRAPSGAAVAMLHAGWNSRSRPTACGRQVCQGVNPPASGSLSFLKQHWACFHVCRNIDNATEGFGGQPQTSNLADDFVFPAGEFANRDVSRRPSRIVGKPESAGINRHVVGDERALRERRAANPSWPRVLQATSRGVA
jgi:hypothetical protein